MLALTRSPLQLCYGALEPSNLKADDTNTWKEAKPRQRALPKSPRYLTLMARLVDLEAEAEAVREQLQRIVIREAVDELEAAKGAVAV